MVHSEMELLKLSVEVSLLEAAESEEAHVCRLGYMCLTLVILNHIALKIEIDKAIQSYNIKTLW